jgi:hypothetical protein
MWRVQTDTASVLHEAATCIKHLHEQIQVSRWRIVLLLTQNGHATDARARGATDLQQVTVSLRPPRFAIHFSSLQILTASYPELSSQASQQVPARLRDHIVASHERFVR